MLMLVLYTLCLLIAVLLLSLLGASSNQISSQSSEVQVKWHVLLSKGQVSCKDVLIIKMTQQQNFKL